MICDKDIPPSYSLIKKNKTFVIIKDEWKEILFKLGINEPEFFLKRSGEQSGDYYGRSALRIVDLPDPLGPMIPTI